MFNIVLSADENYIKYLAVLLTSIVRNTNTNNYQNDLNQVLNHNIPYCFHILTDGISNETKDKLNILEENLNEIYPCKIKIHTMSDDDFQGMPKWGFEDSKNYLTYYRLRLSKAITPPPRISKLILVS